MTVAIEAQGLEKTYRGSLGRGGATALRGVDLRVERGTAFGLIGPNGAGKTTFVKALLGVVRPTSGRVSLLGGDPDDPAVRRRVGYLPERLALPPAWTPVEVLKAVARLKRLGPARAEVARRLEEVGMAEDSGRKVGGFSKGMKQRVGLACALLGSPDLLVLDEPTDGLDPLARVEVRSLLAREIGRGATLFLNSHLLAETERVCGRIGILVEGRVVREGALSDLRAALPRWRLRLAGPEAAIAAAGFSSGGDGSFAFEGEAEAMNAALDRARGAGALVLEVAQDSKDLEAVLAEAVGNEAPGREAGRP
ncbi:MAG TPA: ABC transporter ATP-binding protein [Anaeromyxobacteraceae bacterium]|nr:ABC transporter ATP-binding protein [Anaeromyxobacteraceae bacterium]